MASTAPNRRRCTVLLLPGADLAPLPAPGFAARLTLSVDLPAPSPQRDKLALDRPEPLVAAGGLPLPPIHLRPGRWAVGCT